MPIQRFRASAPRVLVRWLTRLTLLALAIVVMGSIVVTVILPRATHGSALTVLTGSMTPQIPVGSVIVVRPTDPQLLHVGDVATYQVTPDMQQFITHRIIKIIRSQSPTQFVFKGDANPGPDIDPVPAGAIRGKVWFHVPYLGAIRDGLHGKGGISLVAMLLLAGYAMSQLSGAFKERRTRRPEHKETTSPAKHDHAIPIDRPLILASQVLPEGCTDASALAEAAALRWGAIVVELSRLSYTLMLASPPEALDATLEALSAEQWLDVTVVTYPGSHLSAQLQQTPTEADREEQDAAI